MPNYRIVNHIIEIEDIETGNYASFCEEVAVTKVTVDLITQQQWVDVTVYANPAPASLRLPRKELGRNLLPTLIGYGLSVIDNKEQTDFILEVLFDSMSSAPRFFVHTRLGFHTVDGEQVFLAHHPIGTIDPIKAKSEFVVPSKTKPSGSFESWTKLIHKDVLGKKHLELALALSVTAPIAHLLREANLISLLPLWALIGKSSTGKTTAMKVMASIWGSPEESSGLIPDLNATQNAFFAQLADMGGIPALIDETSCVPEWDFGKVIYNLPKGREKLRCNSEGRVRDPAYFSGAIVLTGERSLFDQTNGNAGLAARLVEFTLPWTDDASHAQRLEVGVRSEYGTAVYPLMTWILANKKVIPKIWKGQYEALRREFPTTSGVEDRLIKMYAIILTAASVIKKSLNLPLSTRTMRELLLEVHDANPQIKNDPEVVFEKVKLQILQNFAHFPRAELAMHARTVWGEQRTQNGTDVLWISAAKFEEFLASAGVKDLDSMKHLFFKNGWLDRSSDRHYKFLHALGGIKVRCYRLFMKFECAQSTQTMRSTNSKLNYLLNDD